MKSPGKHLLLAGIILISTQGNLSAFDLHISLFHDHLCRSMMFTATYGDYEVVGSSTLDYCPEGASWYLMLRNDSVYIRDHKGQWHREPGLEFRTEDDYGIFRINPTDPYLESREYRDHLKVLPAMEGLQAVNVVDLEKYVMAVVEAESGSSSPIEFYKVQAILSRTYALRNIKRHEAEGFHLCDGVHCQAYHGRNIWSEDVEIGTEVTDGLVMVDLDSMLINPVYHANSGGETRGAEKIWLKPEPYLKPVLDHFSTSQPNAKWEKNLPLMNWLYYLFSYEIPVPKGADTSDLEMKLQHRQDYYVAFGDSIPVSSVREDFSLRSDFFDVVRNGDMVTLKGRGYGHGVGLSQEGAMQMVDIGYHYTAILNFYYHQIQIMHYLFLEDAGKIELSEFR